MTSKKLNKKISELWMIVLVVIFTAILTVIMVASVNASTDTTRPTITSVSIVNNGENLTRGEQVMVVFNEYMNSSTINSDTFIVTQRTTPKSGVYEFIPVEGIVTYSGLTATFTPNNLFSPNQHYGNVFTANITTGAKDLAGNSLIQDYVWSFTTGNTPFNTGASTSQQNQTDTNITMPAVIPVPVEQPIPPAPVVVAPVTSTVTTPNLSWIWIIVGGAFLLLVVVLIATRVGSSKPQKSEKYIQTTRLSPFGDVHPVMSIEGIGTEYSKRLHTMGIKNTKQLWAADAVKVARQTGASLTAVKSWQNMAELASVKDIGPQYAELLDRSGIHSIAQLQDSNPNELLRAVREKQESLKVNIQGNSPGHATVEHWIEEARDHQFTESMEGQTA